MSKENKQSGCSQSEVESLLAQVVKLQAENERLKEELEIAKGNLIYGHDGKLERTYKKG